MKKVLVIICSLFSVLSFASTEIPQDLEAAIYYVKDVWSTTVLDAQCEPGKFNCAYKFRIDEVLKGDKNSLGKTFDYSLKGGANSFVCYHAVKFIYPCSFKKDQKILFLAERGLIEGVRALLTQNSCDPDFVCWRNLFYATPLVHENSLLKQLISKQATPIYRPFLFFGDLTKLGLDTERLVYEFPLFVQFEVLSVLSNNSPKEKWERYKVKILRIFKNRDTSLVGKEFEFQFQFKINCNDLSCYHRFFEGDKITIGSNTYFKNLLKTRIVRFEGERIEEWPKNGILKKYFVFIPSDIVERFIPIFQMKGYSPPKPPFRVEYLDPVDN